jgi:hypothetical protein
MTHSALISLLGPEFDGFLYAPVGEDRKGMLLSVVSALARLDLDPWQEAAKLAMLPRAMATKRLASLIAALPDRPSAHLDPTIIAARLVALLPRPAGSNIQSPEASPGAGAAISFRTVIYVIFINMIVMALLLGVQILAIRQTPVEADKAHAPVSYTDSPQMPTPSSGQ